MAVFTAVHDDDLARYLLEYDIGDPVRLLPIAEGVENTNYRLETTTGPYVLTLFERRTPADALPYVVGLMRHLHARGVLVPSPIADKAGRYLKNLSDRSSLIVSFLKGRSVKDPGPDMCREAGAGLANLHISADNYGNFRPNPFGIQSWESLAESCAQAGDSSASDLLKEILQALDLLVRRWPYHLPKGACHTDLFPDNVFFEDSRLSGFIDFYFSCDEIRAYDLAICVASWCFDRQNHFVPKRAETMIAGYEALRPLSSDERAALPLLCLGAAVRFTLTRLYDQLYPQEGALVTEKDPGQFAERMRLFYAMSTAGEGIF